MQKELKTFRGYPPPTSSTTYTPNQFFDVVLPNSSRGVVRIVGYMLRRILGWSDADGNPVNPEVSFSYSELMEDANVSRSMIKEAIDEAISKNFIRCVREPQPNLPGQRAVSGLYELCWADEETYIRDIEDFRGFYSGNGNLTYIPNKFFDYTVREESLSVVKVVGAIIRHTIGFQSKFGLRRQRVELPFSKLARLTGISSRRILWEAVQEGISKKHIVKVSEGVFVPGNSEESTAAVYGIKWEDGVSWAEPGPRKQNRSEVENFFAENETGRKGSEVKTQTQDIDRPSATGRKGKRGLGASQLKSRGGMVRNGEREQAAEWFEMENENGLKRRTRTDRKVTLERSEKENDIEITVLNNNNKAVAAPFVESREKLLQAGFDEGAATELARNFPLDRILRQLEAFPNRKASSNPLGLLRRAIEEDWSSPAAKPAEIKISHPARVSFGTTVPETVDPLYVAFVSDEAARVAAQSPELRGQFEAEEEKLRATLASTNFITQNLRPQMLSSFDSERSKQKRWEEFLVKKRIIMPFPQWRKKAVNS